MTLDHITCITGNLHTNQFVFQFKDLMLSVDPPDDDDSDDNAGGGAGDATQPHTYTIKTKAVEDGTGDNAVVNSNHVGDGDVSNDAVMVDRDGDAEPVNLNKESPSVRIES